MNRKVLFVDDYFGQGGAQRVLVNFINGIKQRMNVSVISLCQPKEIFDEIDHNINKHSLFYKRPVFSIFSLSSSIKKINPSVIVVSSSRVYSILKVSAFIARYRGEIICRYPSMPSLEIKEKALSGFRLLFIKLCFNKKSIVIAQSEEMKTDLWKVYNLNLKNIYVINNPINIYDIQNKIKNQKKPFVDENLINIVASGRIYEPKGFDFLIQAFAKSLQLNSKLRLNIIGGDVVGLKASYINLAEQLGCQNEVIFHGHKDNPYPFYNFCDLFVLSSRREGVPNALLENIYLNNKVIATRCVKVVEDIILKSGGGILVDVDNVDELSLAISSYKKIKIGQFNWRDGMSDFIELVLEVSHDI